MNIRRLKKAWRKEDAGRFLTWRERRALTFGGFTRLVTRTLRSRVLRGRGNIVSSGRADYGFATIQSLSADWRALLDYELQWQAFIKTQMLALGIPATILYERD